MDGVMMITAEEYEEYKRLKKEEERTSETIRAQMELQARQARQLAKAVLKAFERYDGDLTTEIVNRTAAEEAIRLADAVLS